MTPQAWESLWAVLPVGLLLLSPFVLLYLLTLFLSGRRRRLFSRLGGELGLSVRDSTALKPATPGFDAFFARPGSITVTHSCEGESAGSRISLGDITFKTGIVPGLTAVGALHGAGGVVAAAATGVAEHRTSYASMKASKAVSNANGVIRPNQNFLGFRRKTGSLAERYQTENATGINVPIEQLLPAGVRGLITSSRQSWDLQVTGDEVMIFPSHRMGFARERQMRFMLSVMREWASELQER